MDSREGHKDLRSRTEEFLQIFRKGEAFTQEVLAENEKLRFRLVQLEEEVRRSGGGDPGKTRVLEEQVASLVEENRRLMERYHEVELENKNFAEKYLEVEQENNNLANLYVASYQLHSTLDFDEVVKTVLEIIMNLVGAEKFAVMIVDEKTRELTAAAAEGIAVEDIPSVTIGEGIIGQVAAEGESYYASEPPAGVLDLSVPIVCIPLKIKEHTIGVIVIYTLLVQKKEFSDVDYELFSMLAGHAATAVFSSKLYSQSERKLETIQSFLDLIKGNPAAE